MYFWPGYEKDILHLVEKCEPCQRRNQPAPTPQAPLGTITSTYPFQKISWDIMGPLPVTEKGSKYILVITDLFSKWVEAFPLSSTNSVTLAEILTDMVICRYGVPEVIHSDQGANFVSEVIQTLCLNLGITRTQTTAYHPQGNGQVERFNRTLESMLSKVASENQRNWDENLQKVLFAYRTAVHDSTGYTPFLVMFGRSPNLPVDVMLGRYREDSGSSVPKYVQRTRALMKAAFSDVHKRIKKSHYKQKGVADQRCVVYEFQVGDRVWLYVPAVRTGQTKKLASLWRGPYTVIDKLNAVNYRIQLMGGNKTLVVHHNRLKLCKSNPTEDDVLLEETPPAAAETQPPESESNAGLVIIENGMLPFEPEMVQPAEVLGEVYQEAVEQNEQPQEERQVDQPRRYPSRNRRPPGRYQAGFT